VAPRSGRMQTSWRSLSQTCGDRGIAGCTTAVISPPRVPCSADKTPQQRLAGIASDPVPHREPHVVSRGERRSRAHGQRRAPRRDSGSHPPPTNASSPQSTRGARPRQAGSPASRSRRPVMHQRSWSTRSTRSTPGQVSRFPARALCGERVNPGRRAGRRGVWPCGCGGCRSRCG